MTIEATGQSFQVEVLAASAAIPVLVDFWAPWCGPCRTLGPILEKMAIEFAERVKLVKINTDDEQELAGRYGIRGIPAVKAFRDGNVVDEFVGAQPASVVREFIERQLQSPRDNPQPTVLTEIATLIDAGQIAEAQERLDQLPLDMATEPAVKRERARLYFSRLAAQPSSEELADEHILAAREIMGGQVRPALDRLLRLAKRDRTPAGTRKSLVIAFDLLDDADLVGKYRRELARILH
jgi:putative thioredoxin